MPLSWLTFSFWFLQHGILVDCRGWHFSITFAWPDDKAGEFHWKGFGTLEVRDSDAT